MSSINLRLFFWSVLNRNRNEKLDLFFCFIQMESDCKEINKIRFQMRTNSPKPVQPPFDRPFPPAVSVPLLIAAQLIPVEIIQLVFPLWQFWLLHPPARVMLDDIRYKREIDKN